ncbi:MAG TPA: hypothetical protein VGG89_06950 [Candidatus Baltobacteraceae bacterium]
MFARRHWIPPAGLLFGQLCHGASWLLALSIAMWLHADPTVLPAIAWIHLVALGWITVTAFSILLHAIPAFLDVTWKHESLARVCVGIAAAAIAAFVVTLCVAVPALGIAASVVAIALLTYLVTAWETLAGAFRSEDRIDRAVARAFAMTLAMLALAIALGLSLAWALTGAFGVSWISRLPGAHANVALFGWLTLLIYGVSACTLRPITGTRSRWTAMHIVVGTATLVGALVLPAGLALGSETMTWIGAALLALGAAAYVVDTSDVLLRSTNPHGPPKAFVAAALVWLAVAMVLGAGVLLGHPWQAAYVFVLLMGWVAQMVDAHVFHIGVRLVSTIYRGEDDETRPIELLDARLAWLSFVLFQLAVAALAAGLLLPSKNACALGAFLGLCAWVVTMTAMIGARRAARA